MKNENAEKKDDNLAIGISTGLALGTTFGILMDNLAIGIGLGLAIGVAIGNGSRKKKQNKECE